MKNSIRQFAFSQFELPELEREAIEYIQSHEPPEGYYVGFSGGKDSIALLHLVRQSGVKYAAYHALTSIDPPQVLGLIKRHYPEVQILKAPEAFYKMVERKGPPLRMVRWCCTELKEKVSMHIPLPIRLMGIRAEESVRRAARGRESEFKVGKTTQTVLKPIFHWPEWAIWELIDKYKLPYPSLYDEGFSRIGCVCCPFQFGTSEPARMRLKQSQERFPGIWRAFETSCRAWWKNKNQDAYWNGLPFEKWYAAYLTGEKIEKPSK